mmetsp:Transcript_10198/g.25602  ORF Transcript_10198/g.25602 Transcript_10198/m.25602 type:complete len:678 (-) Transcript_10198:101-2134(-)
MSSAGHGGTDTNVHLEASEEDASSDSQDGFESKKSNSASSLGLTEKHRIPYRAGEKIRAIAAYKGRNQAELTLAEGDIVVFLQANERGWGLGKLHQSAPLPADKSASPVSNPEKGWFPLSFVEKMEPSSARRSTSSRVGPPTNLQKLGDVAPPLHKLKGKKSTSPLLLNRSTSANPPSGEIKRNLLPPDFSQMRSFSVSGSPASTPSLVRSGSSFDNCNAMIPIRMPPTSTSQSSPVHPKSPLAVQIPMSTSTPNTRAVMTPSAGAEPSTLSPERETPPPSKPGEELSPKAMREQAEKTVRELITTEREYIKDIEVLVELIMTPMGTKRDFLTGELLVTPQQMSNIFSNVSILPSVNKVLLQNLEIELELLEKDSNAEIHIGGVFLKTADYLKMYLQYCANQPTALKTINELKENSQFEAFLEEKRNMIPECRKLDLQSFLIKPMQRVCKYPLLLRELIKFTSDSHSDYQDLIKAMKKVESVVEEINTKKGENENRLKMLDIKNNLDFGTCTDVKILSPSRFLVAEFSFKKIQFKRKETFRGVMYVFNDIIILAKEGKFDGKRTKYRCSCDPKELMVFSNTASKEDKGDFSIILTAVTLHVVLGASTLEERENVIQVLASVGVNVSAAESSKMRSLVSAAGGPKTPYPTFSEHAMIACDAKHSRKKSFGGLGFMKFK